MERIRESLEYGFLNWLWHTLGLMVRLLTMFECGFSVFWGMALVDGLRLDGWYKWVNDYGMTTTWVFIGMGVTSWLMLVGFMIRSNYNRSEYEKHHNPYLYALDEHNW